MADPLPVIPSRAFFKAAEVCDLAHVQPYVLRTWEREFPNLGVKRGEAGRVYRRADVELVLRIKQLVFAEGLTLAGARRRIEGEPQPATEPLPFDPFDEATRERLTKVKDGLRSILAMLSGDAAPSVAVPSAAPAGGDGKAGTVNPAAEKAPSRAADTRRRAAARPAKRGSAHARS